jgi:hypothetical protein
MEIYVGQTDLFAKRCSAHQAFHPPQCWMPTGGRLPSKANTFSLGNCRRRTERFGLELSASAMGRLLGPPIARHWENMSRTQYPEARLGPLHKQRHLSSGYSTFTLTVVPRCPNLSIVSNYCNLASASIFAAANGVIDWLSAISSTSHSFSLNKPTLALTSCRS